MGTGLAPQPGLEAPGGTAPPRLPPTSFHFPVTSEISFIYNLSVTGN